MALVRNITKRVDIVGEAEQFAIIRKLSWKQLAAANEAHTNTAMVKMKAMGGELFRAISDAQAQGKPTEQVKQAVDAAAQAIVPVKKADPRDSYDTGTVLGFGVANLSYVEKFVAADVDDLDEPTAKFLKNEILDFAGVGQSEEQAKEETKNA